jgi:hypothetical protein
MIAQMIVRRQESDAGWDKYAAENPSSFAATQSEWRRSAKAKELEERTYRHIRAELALHPAERLRQSIAYWQAAESDEDPDDDHYMPELDLRPCLAEAKERLVAGNLEGAVIVLRNACTRMGSVFPNDLDIIHGPTWADIVIENRRCA